MKPKIIKNFLEPDVFKKLKENIFSSYFPWFYQENVAYEGRTEKETFGFTHMFFQNQRPSQMYTILDPILAKLDMKALIRAKANFYPNQGKQKIHPLHTDFPYPHKGFLLSLNSTNGYTSFPDGTKIIGKENQAMFWDASKPHQSSTPTDAKCRINIVINYF